MCLAMPGKVVKVKGDSAVVDYGTEKREAMLLNPDIKVGDYVFVQNKLIIQKVPKKDALAAIKAWQNGS